MNGSRSVRTAALALWIAAVLCFAGSWLYDEPGLVGTGTALLTLFIVLAARARSAAGGNAEPSGPRPE